MDWRIEMSSDGKIVDVKIDRIEGDINKIGAALDRMSWTLEEQSRILAVNTTSLELHMQRTKQLEDRVGVIEKVQNRMLGALIICQIGVPIAMKLLLK